MTDQYIACGECGNTIAMYYRFFDAAKRAYYAKYLYSNKKMKDIDPSKLVFIKNNEIDLQPIFEALKIDNDCCRMHIISKTQIGNMPTRLN
jgi:hypothetical protein